MKLLVISDAHGSIESLDKLDSQIKECDGIIFAGDFSKFNEPETGLPLMEAMCKKHDTIFSVIGNCDDPVMLTEAEARDINVQGTLVQHEGLFFAGSGGGSVFTNTTPFERSEDELMSDLKIITDQGDESWDNLVLILHNPPKDTDCDKISAGVHVGLQGFTDFINKYKPLVVVTGHIHESVAVCKMGETTVINPGALFENRYAWLEVSKSDGKWKVDTVELKTL